MTTKEYDEYNQKAINGTLADDLNPIFIFSMTNSQLLVDVLAGKYDLIELAKRQLENRGLDENGKWVGFNRPTQKLKFSDGMEFETGGELRKEERHDGWYVLGQGRLIPVKDETEADKYIKKFKK